MARRPASPEVVELLVQQAGMAAGPFGGGMTATEFASTIPPRPKRSVKIAKDRIAKLRAEVAKMVEEKGADWARANSGHVVALYMNCHLHVYGVEAEELLDSKAFGLAIIKASRFLNQNFSGDVVELVGFVRWTWAREASREKKASQGEARRVGWNLQFSPTLLTDYRRWALHEGRKKS